MKRTITLMAALLLWMMSLPAAAQDSTATTDSTLPVFAPPECAYVPDQPTSQACLDRMATSAEPDFERVRQDGATLSLYSFWRVGPDAINKYDAPGGNVTSQIPAGFNFVTAIDTSNPDWIQIQGGEWVSQTDAKYIEPSYFTGVLLPSTWDQPFAWVLDTTGIYASLRPGEEGSAESGYLTRRYDMVNIFAEAYDSEGWRWYMIGPNQWLKQTFVAKIQPAPQPLGIEGRWVAVDLYEQTLVAYQDGTPVFATLIASGLDGSETNEGRYTIWARMPNDRMSGAAGAPDAYDLQSVPWVMYFDESISLHGTYWHDLFGYRHSHGCVNLSVSDARWLFEWTEGGEPDANGEVKNTVFVFSSGIYGEPPQAASS